MSYFSLNKSSWTTSALPALVFDSSLELVALSNEFLSSRFVYNKLSKFTKLLSPIGPG